MKDDMIQGVHDDLELIGPAVEDGDAEDVIFAKERRIAHDVFRILSEVVRDKEDLGLHGRFRTAYQYGRNQHWKDTGSSGIKPISANLLFKHRQRTANTLTNNNPTFEIRGYGDNQEEVLEKVNQLQKTIDHWWNETEQQAFFAKSVYNGETYGVAIEKMTFDPDAEFGIGEAETVNVDPYHFGLYPVASQYVQDAEAVLHFYPMEIRAAKRKWPEKESEIKSDASFLDELGDDRREMVTGNWYDKGLQVTYDSTVSVLYGDDGSSQDPKSKQTVICEIWFKDYSTKTVETQAGMEMDAGAMESMTVETVPKYPGYIRCVTICTGGLVVLDDRPNPSINETLPDDLARLTYLYDKYPFAAAQSIDDTSTFWSPSDYEQLIGIQQEINKCLTQMNAIKNKIARAKLIVPEDSGIPDDHLDNLPGILRPATTMQSQGIRYLEVPFSQLADILKNMEVFTDLFFQVSGTFDVDMAQQTSTGHLAYKSIAALLEQAATMMRGKIRNYMGLIRERGRMYKSHVMNWYSEDRWIAYEDEGSQKPLQINGHRLIIPAKLRVVSGSTMPVSRIQKREEAIELFKARAIDVEELLKSLEWCDYKKVLARMKEGPLGEVMKKLAYLFKAYPQIVQQLQQLLYMDPKEFVKLVQSGKLMPFEIRPQQQGQPPPDPVAMAQAEKIKAEIGKINADIRLIMERTMSERVDQQVKMKGIGFDEQKLIMERAKLVADVGTKQKELDVKASESRHMGPYAERGMKSNNVEAE